MGLERVGHDVVTQQQQKEAVMEPSSLQPASQKHRWPLVIGGEVGGGCGGADLWD